MNLSLLTDFYISKEAVWLLVKLKDSPDCRACLIVPSHAPCILSGPVNGWSWHPAKVKHHT